jgi:hypothetical protein
MYNQQCLIEIRNSPVPVRLGPSQPVGTGTGASLLQIFSIHSNIDHIHLVQFQ